MVKTPTSKLAIGFYAIGVLWLVSAIYTLKQFMQMEQFSSAASTLGFGVTTIGSGILYAVITIMLGRIVQLVADIRWKLFEGEANA